MSEERKERIAGTVFWITLSASIAMLVAGFLTPPRAVIDGSVLTAVGELFAFAALAVGLEAVRLGRSLRISKGDIVAEVTRHKKRPRPASDNEDIAKIVDRDGETI